MINNMSFDLINPLMLTGLAGLSLPVLAHLISRRRYDVVSWGAMLHETLQAAEQLESEGVSAEVLDVATLKPLDMRSILESVSKTTRCVIVHEAARSGGWGAEIVSIAADEAFWDLDGPVERITTPHIPLPAADLLEDEAIPSVARIYQTIRRTMQQ